eukprot:6392443-Pyramimonas_sp.AAC.1
MKVTRCRTCNQKGHWSRGCPKNAGADRRMAACAFNGMASTDKVLSPEAMGIWRTVHREIKEDDTFL